MSSPALLSVTSSDNQTITLHFDRVVHAGDNAIVISNGFSQTYLTANGLATRIVGSTDSRTVSGMDPQISISGTDVTIHLSSALQSGGHYSITMGNGAVIDGDDHANSAISSTKLFQFVASGTPAVVAPPSAVIGAAIHFIDNGNDTSDYVTSVREQTVTGTFSGTLGAHDSVQVSLDNGASWHQATISGNSWSYSGQIDTDHLASSDGNYTSMLLARVGNTASQNSGTASHGYTLHTAQPAASVNENVSFSADSGSSDTDHVTNVAQQTVSGTYSGTLGAGDKVQISLDNGSSWIDASAGDGQWSANNITLQQGEHELQVRVVDDFGTGSCIQYVNYTLQTSTVSLAGHALTLPEEEDKGASHSDGVTRAPGAVDLNVAGLHGFHAGDTIQIIDTNHGGAVVGSYVIESGDLYYGDDYFSQSYYNPAQLTSKNLSLSALSDGEHTLVAQVLDQAGNISSVTSGALDLLIDNVAPQLTGSTPADSSGTVSPSISQLVFSFSEDIDIEDGAVITIVDADDASSYQEVTLHSSNINGNTLTVTLTAPLTSGTHYKVLGVAISDLAGNAGVTGDAILLQFTTTGSYPAPAAPSVTLTGDTAPASSAGDAPTHSDGITRYNTVHVTDDGKSTWYYRIGDSDSWHEGSGASFTLADGHYAAGAIQVKQSSHGVDSPVTVLGETTIDTHAFTDDTLSGNHFIETNTSVTGSLVGAQTLSDQIIEITLDHGVTWKAATLTPTDATHADWTLGGLDLTNAIEYGVRIADKAGNVTGTAYYLTAREASYNHPEYNDIVLHAAGGIDYITVGARANVDGGGGYGDIVVTGDDAVVSVGNDSHVTTGNGNNLVSTGFGANIVTGSGNDRIYVSTVDGAHISAGGGNDWLQSNSGVNGLRLESLDISGVETFNFGYSGGNDLTINTAASVRATSGTGTLTFTSTFAGSHIHLNAAQWIADGIQGDYQHYHSSNSSEVLLIGQNITVDNNIGSA